MDKTETLSRLKTRYDAEQDILYLTFMDKACEAIAEEIGDEVFVRFKPDALNSSTSPVIWRKFLGRG